MKSLLTSACILALLGGAAVAQTTPPPPPAPAGAPQATPPAPPPGAHPGEEADAGPDGHGPDGRGPEGRGPDSRGPDGHGPDWHGPEGREGWEGPHARFMPPPPPRGARFHAARGDAVVDVRCSDDEPLKLCADTALQMIDKVIGTARP